MSHLAVAKTYKLYIGGAFPRSESGRTYRALDASGGFLANAALASRKDARDAVVAARKGFAGWSKATPYNRGQVIYRIAEMLEGRSAQFVELIMVSTGAKEKVGPGRGRGGGRPAGALRRLDRQADGGAGQRQPGLRPVLLLLRPGADRGGRGVRAAAGRRCWVWCRWSRR